MTDPTKPASLDGLVQAATQSVRQQQEKAAAQAAIRPSRSRTQQIFSLVLFVVLIGVFIYQYPRIREPYEIPDLNTQSTVVEGDLTLIAELIESDRVIKGKYPDTLDEVRLPAGLAERFERYKPDYRVSADSYRLEWQVPPWRAVLDSGTRKIVVTRAGASR